MARFRDDGDAFYMEKHAFRFFTDFPDVPDFLRPVYSRFLDVGLIWMDPNAEATGEWPSQLRWTAAGRELREAYEENFPSRGINFFARATVKRLLPQGDHTKHMDRIFTTEIPRGTLAPQPSGLRYALAGLEIACERLTETIKARRRA